MRKILARLTAGALFAAMAGIVTMGRAAAVTADQCTTEGGGIIILEMDGTKNCLGGFYTEQQILFS
jgi:hypothetical protein